jgi:hypothetical protein
MSIRVEGQSISVVDDKTGEVKRWGVWDPDCEVVFETLDRQINARIEKMNAYQRYNEQLADYQGAVDSGRLEITQPPLILPVKPLMRVVADPVVDQHNQVQPGKETMVAFVPVLRDVVYPKITPTQVNT